MLVYFAWPYCLPFLVFLSWHSTAAMSLKKTDAKIDDTLKVSLDANTWPQIHPRLPRLPSIIQTSPSMPITRNITNTIPDLPPPGMAGAIARIHGLQKTMAMWHFTQDGKPFYLDPQPNQLVAIWNGVGWKVTGANTAMHVAEDGEIKATTSQFDKERTKRSQSVPTYSASVSQKSIIVEPNTVSSTEQTSTNNHDELNHSSHSQQQMMHRKQSSEPVLDIEVAVMKETYSLKKRMQLSMDSPMEHTHGDMDEDDDDDEEESVDEPTPEDIRQTSISPKEEDDHHHDEEL